VQWHVRHVLQIWVGVRVLVAMAFALSAAFSPPGPGRDSPLAMSMSMTAVLTSLTVVMVVTEIDRRRIGAPLLYANLGYSARWTAMTTLLLVIFAETLVQVLARVSGTAQ